MVALTTQQAAELVGKNRSTIWRAIKRGRVSAAKTETGDYIIEPAELERAFGPLQRRNEMRDDALRPTATGNETSTLRVETNMLRERVAALEADKADLRAERDRLLGVIEQQAEQMRLLTDQREDASQTSWWHRMFGRA
jgi:excisionase family DNA binding protein